MEAAMCHQSFREQRYEFQDSTPASGSYSPLESGAASPVTFTTQDELRLRDYRQTVKLWIRNEDSRPFPNESAEHARIVIEEFLESAQETVLVYCGRLSRVVYEPLVEYFQKTLSRNVQVQVIIESGVVETEALSKILGSRIHHADRQEDMGKPHFLLVDGKRYRVETNSRDRRAVVCACASNRNATEQTAKELKAFFSRAWDNSTALMEQNNA